MKFRELIAIATIPVVMLASGIASAATDGEAVRACSTAIAAAIEKKQGIEPGLKVDQSNVSTRRRLTGYTAFELDARDSSSNDVIGRYTCVVNRRAEVRRLTTLSLNGPSAEQRSGRLL